ncbi:uncharacterized protein LOC122792730 [Protopterus annectens]|uniref:uncharacterized protein LOC122792730 n=1 Tax=Protopterus annectens TaxID=7888 RepID=UPI001CFBACCD|nr:uncharacterized protein LOC122792730 [Protopterus annectens]
MSNSSPLYPTHFGAPALFLQPSAPVPVPCMSSEESFCYGHFSPGAYDCRTQNELELSPVAMAPFFAGPCYMTTPVYVADKAALCHFSRITNPVGAPFLTCIRMSTDHFSRFQGPSSVPSVASSVHVTEVKTYYSVKKEILNRQLRDLCCQAVCLEVDDARLLGWYIKLSSEDRQIIKAEGSLTDYLKKNPYLEVINNFVRLKAPRKTGWLSAGEEVAEMPYLNKPKIASSYGDWRCGSCGFTNSLDVLDCTNCQKLKKSSEENFSLKDENVTRSNSEKMMNTCPLGENAVCPVTVGDNHRSADNCMKGNQYSHNVECDYKAIPKSSLKLKLPFNIKSSKKKSLELLSHRGVLVPAQEIDDTSGPILASKNFEALNVSLDTEFEMFRKENEEGFCSVKTNLHEEVASLTPSNIYETEKRHLVESVAQETFSQYGSLDSRRICRYVSEHICSAPCEDMNTTTTEHKVLHAGTVAVKNKECSGTYSEDSINLSFVSASESVGTVDKQIVELNDASVNTEHKLQDSDFPTACLSMNSSDEVNDVYQIMIETASLNTVSEKAMGTKERGGCAVKFCSHDLQSEFADGTQCIASEEKKDAPWCQAEGSSNSSSTAFLFKTVSNTKWKMLLEDSRILSPEVLEIAADAELKDSFVTVDENFDTDRVMVQRKGEKSCKGNDIAKQDKLCLKLIEDSSASDDCHDIRTKLIVMHRKCTSCLDKKPGISKSVDVSADFKNCLKVSRSTMTKPDTTSRADNTDLSMMNSTKPGRSKNGSYRNSACNTEKWPFCQSTVVDQGSQTVYSEMKNKCIGTDKQTLEWNAVVKVSQKCENNKESIKKGETRCRLKTISFEMRSFFKESNRLEKEEGNINKLPLYNREEEE